MAYEKFAAWKVSHRLALKVYEVTRSCPPSERYQLTAQIRRAALSAPTNIAEGAAKRGTREFRRYLDITLGSLSELSYLLRFSRDSGILVGTPGFLMMKALKIWTVFGMRLVF